MFQFDAIEADALKYYVYLYSDPRNGHPFYIGKGYGNRVFAHLNDESENAKSSRIRELREERLEPQIEILAFGLDETTAFKVEAAAIDLIGFDNLTNRVVGHGANRFGRMSIEEVHGKLASRPVESFDDDCVLIRINDMFGESATLAALDLYDATRGTWRLSLASASKARFALAVHASVVREVYEIARWLPAGSTMYIDPNRDTEVADRFEFVGKIAQADVRVRYRWKSVAHLYKAGAANPVMYVGPHREPEVVSDGTGVVTPGPDSDLDTVVVAARSAYPEYLEQSAYICQPERYFKASATRMGFYADGEIKSEIATILYSEESVLFTSEEAETRLRSVHEEVRRVGELINLSLRDGLRPEGEPYKVMLLSMSHDPLTAQLPHSIKNDKTTASGKSYGWTLSQRYASLDALQRGPRFTSQLGTTDDDSE